MASLVLELALLLIVCNIFVIGCALILDWYYTHCIQRRMHPYDRRAELGNFDGPLLGKIL